LTLARKLPTPPAVLGLTLPSKPAAVDKVDPLLKKRDFLYVFKVFMGVVGIIPKTLGCVLVGCSWAGWVVFSMMRVKVFFYAVLERIMDSSWCWVTLMMRECLFFIVFLSSAVVNVLDDVPLYFSN
jgi:hypothetical protein